MPKAIKLRDDTHLPTRPADGSDELKEKLALERLTFALAQFEEQMERDEHLVQVIADAIVGNRLKRQQGPDLGALGQSDPNPLARDILGALAGAGYKIVSASGGPIKRPSAKNREVASHESPRGELRYLQAGD